MDLFLAFKIKEELIQEEEKNGYKLNSKEYSEMS